MKHKLLSLLLAIILVVSLFPVAAHAASPCPNGGTHGWYNDNDAFTSTCTKCGATCVDHPGWKAAGQYYRCTECNISCPHTSTVDRVTNCQTGKYVRDCAICGKKLVSGSEQLFNNDYIGRHNYDANYKCSSCGQIQPCNERDGGTGTHSYVAAGGKYTCSACGHVCDHSGEKKDRVTNCGTGAYVQDCKACGATNVGTSGTKAEYVGHKDDNSDYICDICGYKTPCTERDDPANPDQKLNHTWPNYGIDRKCTVCDTQCQHTTKVRRLVKCDTGKYVEDCSTCGAQNIGETGIDDEMITGHSYSDADGKCSVCGDVQSCTDRTDADGNPLNHTWSAATGECSVCGATCDHTDAEGEKTWKWVYPDHFCDEDAEPGHYINECCETCGKSNRHIALTPGVHYYVDRVCIGCGETCQHENWQDDNDCTTDDVCGDCGTLIKEGNAQHRQPVVAPGTDCTISHTCANDGCEVVVIQGRNHSPEGDDGDCSTAVTCTNCDYEYVAARTHTPDEDDNNCETPVVCTNSNCSQIVIAAKTHVAGEDDGDCTTPVLCANEGCTVPVVAPQAHVAGEDDNDCTTPVLCAHDGCNVIVVAAKAHTEKVTAEAVPPTCEGSGLTAAKVCTVCGKTLSTQEVVPATGHDWDEGKITTPATSKKDGIKTYTCKNDPTHTKTEKVKYVDDYDDVPKTGDNTGLFLVALTGMALTCGLVCIFEKKRTF